MFIDILDVDETIAQLLVTEGFGSADEIIDVEVEEIASIEGFDMDVASEIKLRAEEYVQAKDKENENKRRELGVHDDIAMIEKVSPEMLVIFGENNIKTLDDLGDLASDELLELVPDLNLSEEDANTIIMSARAHWFDDDPNEKIDDDEVSNNQPGSVENTEL